MTKFLAFMLAFSLSLAAPAQQSTKPKVRAITAFVRLDRSTWQSQVAEALRTLREAKSQFESSGYQVQTIRITTAGMSSFTHSAMPSGKRSSANDADPAQSQEAIRTKRSLQAWGSHALRQAGM